MESLQRIAKERELFLDSNTKIFCSNCGIIFYDDSTRRYMSPLFFDFKMLAFRHVWDTKHSVKIDTSYLTVHRKEFRKAVEAHTRGKHKEATRLLQKLGILPFNLTLYTMGFDLGRFNPELQLDYTAFVNDLRKKFEERQDERLHHSFEENWDENSTCFCSECQREYHSAKEACYCCQETKAWMPWFEVSSLGI